jgi:hypothetical protein
VIPGLSEVKHLFGLYLGARMRIVICLLVAAIPAAYWIGVRQARADPSYVHPSAAEAFRLRSECAKLTEGIAEAKRPYSLVGSVVSRYDVRTNRCYAELQIDVADRLYDVQTGEILAEVWSGTPHFAFIKGGRTILRKVPRVQSSTAPWRMIGSRDRGSSLTIRQWQVQGNTDEDKRLSLPIGGPAKHQPEPSSQSNHRAREAPGQVASPAE